MLNVKLEPDRSQKYVLARYGEDIFLWGDSAATWHKDIVEGIPEENVVVEGGGRIKVISAQKLIYFWDRSSRYGEPPPEHVEKILKECYQDYHILHQVPPVE